MKLEISRMNSEKSKLLEVALQLQVIDFFTESENSRVILTLLAQTQRQPLATIHIRLYFYLFLN
jgi:hypothetical protein